MDAQFIGSRIFTIRGLQVMLDSDLAEVYGVDSKRLNEQVKRNMERFPREFRFQFTQDEFDILRSQFATLKQSDMRGLHRKYLPYAFTEQGVAMLSSVLKSSTAIQASIYIMKAFVEMRHQYLGSKGLLTRMDLVEHKQILTDQRVDTLFDAMEAGKLPPKQGIFFEGQVFDAHAFVSPI